MEFIYSNCKRKLEAKLTQYSSNIELWWTPLASPPT